MKATVFFEQRNRETGEVEGYELMARVDCSGRTWDDAIEYAYLRTQNIHGSWSRCERIGDEVNPDFSEDVEVIKPLQTYDGQVMGHRSMMVGDRVIFDGCWYECAAFGFKQISNAHDDVYIAPAEVA